MFGHSLKSLAVQAAFTIVAIKVLKASPLNKYINL
jgi:hypothetical protein